MDLCKLSAELDALLSDAANFDSIALASTTIQFMDYYWHVQIEYTGCADRMFYCNDFTTLSEVKQFFDMATVGACIAAGVEV